jgi:GT2 family glycosyltransferase
MNMEKLPISICILSWKTGKTLRNTLKSYQKYGLLNMIDDIVILFQEVSESDKKLADQYNIRYIGLKDNIGIGKGMKTLAENAVCENILFWNMTLNLLKIRKPYSPASKAD